MTASTSVTGGASACCGKGNIVHFRVVVLVSVLFITMLSLRFQADLPLYSYPYLDGSEDLVNPSRFNTFSENRPSVHRDEFHHKGPSQAEINEFFRFDPPSDTTSPIPLQRMWTCTDPAATPLQGRPNKLVYLQMPRVAGSTVRTLLRAYAEYCKAGLAVVNHCLDLGLEFMQGADYWANGKGSQREAEYCYLSYAVNRTGTESEVMAPVSTTFLNENVDILAGKLPLGSDLYWVNPQGQHVDAQYVVFVRDPLEKYVSSLLFDSRSRNLTLLQAVEFIHKVTMSRIAAGNYHEKYSTHLITPEQTAWAVSQRVLWSPERRTNLSLSNLANTNILIGVTERMLDSVQLLEYVLDADEQVPSLFKFFGSDPRIVERARLVTRNMTEPVVEKIRANRSLLAIMDEYLKYDRMIYDFAVRLHERQYRWLEGTRRKPSER